MSEQPEPTPPTRACTLELRLGADSRKEILASLRQIEYLIDTEQMTEGCSGGVGSGYSYSYKEREEPTSEQYHEQLQAYLAARKENDLRNARQAGGAGAQR